MGPANRVIELRLFRFPSVLTNRQHALVQEAAGIESDPQHHQADDPRERGRAAEIVAAFKV